MTWRSNPIPRWNLTRWDHAPLLLVLYGQNLAIKRMIHQNGRGKGIGVFHARIELERGEGGGGLTLHAVVSFLRNERMTLLVTQLSH